MKSSDNQYWIALDHVRAFAALLVFTWHFTHGWGGTPIPFAGAPAIFPFALFDEGHTGVAVFMTLSGYLFAKILDGRQISFSRFLWNRTVRLFPLLIAVMILNALLIWKGHGDLSHYPLDLIAGFILPTWPNGGWSIAVELHFYLALPLVMSLARRDTRLLLLFVLVAMIVRAVCYAAGGDVQNLAYYTIVGRIDQFVLGIFFYFNRDLLKGRGPAILAGLTVFLGFYWLFDTAGGFYELAKNHPSAMAIWIVLPTIEGVAYALAIAWYDVSFSPENRGVSKLIAQYGGFSYSIYLLHFFLYDKMSRFVDGHIVRLENIYVAIAFAVLAFASMYPLSWLSFRFIEEPFLRLRVKYTRPQASIG